MKKPAVQWVFTARGHEMQRFCRYVKSKLVTNNKYFGAIANSKNGEISQHCITAMCSVAGIIICKCYNHMLLYFCTCICVV